MPLGLFCNAKTKIKAKEDKISVSLRVTVTNINFESVIDLLIMLKMEYVYSFKQLLSPDYSSGSNPTHVV